MRKNWYAFLTIGGRIRPILLTWRKLMNEELKAASRAASDPMSISWLTYGWVLALAIWGGLVRVIREEKYGTKTWPQLLRIFLVEMFTSAFVGVITFYLCEASNIQPLYTAALTSTAGWMGVRAMSLAETIYRARQPKAD